MESVRAGHFFPVGRVEAAVDARRKCHFASFGASTFKDQRPNLDPGLDGAGPATLDEPVVGREPLQSTFPHLVTPAAAGPGRRESRHKRHGRQ